MDNNGLVVLTFNEEQKAAVARALMAVAEQMIGDDKTELSNKADNSSNFELLDALDTDVTESDIEQLLASTSSNITGKDYNSPNAFITLTNLAADDVNVQLLSANDVARLQAKSLETSMLSTITKVEAEAEANDIALDADTMSESATLDCIIDDDSSASASTSALCSEEMTLSIDDNDCDDVTLGNDSDDEAAPKNFSNNDQEKKCKNNILLNYTYYCPECGVYCGDLHAWKVHTGTEHQFRSKAILNIQNATVGDNGEYCYRCKLCQKTFNKRTRFLEILRHHIEIHMPPYLKCGICSKMLHSISTMTRHLRTKHRTNAQQYNYQHYIEMRCPVCNLTVASYAQWKVHLNNEHQYFEKLSERVRVVKDMIVACNACGKEITTTGKEQHLLIHEKYHGFHCKLCNEFSSANLINCNNHITSAHLETMSADMKSKICSKMCESSAPLSRYLSIQHKRMSHKTNYHLYMEIHCPVCNVKLADHSQWIIHLAEKHQYYKKLSERVHFVRDKFVACNVCGKEFMEARKEQHMLIHEKYHGFRCRLCRDYSSSLLTNCINHIKKKHEVN